jgi:hypothetical protein
LPTFQFDALNAVINRGKKFNAEAEVQATVRALREVLRAAGVGEFDALKAVVVKLLWNEPGSVRQRIHADIVKKTRYLGHRLRKQCFAFILHLGDGVQPSTHVPKVGVEESRRKVMDDPLYECHEANYQSFAMDLADLMLFRTDLSHCGPGTSSGGAHRYVV